MGWVIAGFATGRPFAMLVSAGQRALYVDRLAIPGANISEHRLSGDGQEHNGRECHARHRRTAERRSNRRARL